MLFYSNIGQIKFNLAQSSLQGRIQKILKGGKHNFYLYEKKSKEGPGPLAPLNTPVIACCKNSNWKIRFNTKKLEMLSDIYQSNLIAVMISLKSKK